MALTPAGEAKPLEGGLSMQRYHLAVQTNKPVKSCEAKIKVQFADAPLLDEEIVISVVDGRSLLCVDQLDFGVVKTGIPARRAFVVRTADGVSLGEMTFKVHGGGRVDIKPEKSLSDDRLLVAAAFVSTEVGASRGEIQLIPDGSAHESRSIAYLAEVGP